MSTENKPFDEIFNEAVTNFAKIKHDHRFISQGRELVKSTIKALYHYSSTLMIYIKNIDDEIITEESIFPELINFIEKPEGILQPNEIRLRILIPDGTKIKYKDSVFVNLMKENRLNNQRISIKIANDSFKDELPYWMKKMRAVVNNGSGILMIPGENPKEIFFTNFNEKNPELSKMFEETFNKNFEKSVDYS